MSVYSDPLGQPAHQQSPLCPQICTQSNLCELRHLYMFTPNTKNTKKNIV